ncbi:hypothetical protein [Nannocystis pusilla]|uniref:hypothetical protein n=1 Tax=Nannocystis pusilla TaxID=889268 RepID=UPI003BEF8889
MPAQDLDQALQAAKIECAALAEQLRLARADLHRLGAQGMNRTLIAGSIASALGMLVGLTMGWRMARKTK